MRSREEVLTEYNIERDEEDGCLILPQHRDTIINALADRIRELESPPRPEPVAWARVSEDDRDHVCYLIGDNNKATVIREQLGCDVRPLVFGDVTHPSAAAENAKRYVWLKERLLGADWHYETADGLISVMTFKIPEYMRVSANLDATIDSALTPATPDGAQ